MGGRKIARAMTIAQTRDYVRRLRQEYDRALLDGGDDEALRLHLRFEALEQWEQDMLLVHADKRSMTATARVFRISRQSAYNYVREIRRKLI